MAAHMDSRQRPTKINITISRGCNLYSAGRQQGTPKMSSKPHVHIAYDVFQPSLYKVLKIAYSADSIRM